MSDPEDHAYPIHKPISNRRLNQHYRPMDAPKLNDKACDYVVDMVAEICVSAKLSVTEIVQVQKIVTERLHRSNLAVNSDTVQWDLWDAVVGKMAMVEGDADTN